MAKRYWINYLKEYVFTPTAPANDTTSRTGTFKAIVERILNQQAAMSGKPEYQTPDTTLSNAATHIADASGAAHGGVYNRIQKDGVDVAKQHILNFTGPGVTVSDDGANGRTNTDIAGGGGAGGGSAHIIQEEGASLTARSRLNFVGEGATATDDSANDRSNVSIRGNVFRSGTAPSSPIAGQLWADTTTNPETLRVYSGSAWNPTSGTPGDGTVTDVKVASGAAIAKTKLALTGTIDTADLLTDRTLLVTTTSATRPSSPRTGQAIYETDTQQVNVNTGTPGAPVWTSITASSAYQDTQFLQGLQLTWDAANTLGIETGAAYIPGISDVMEVPTRLTRAVSFAASATAFYYVYLFSNGGSPDIEVTTTAPDPPYRGTARTKSGATTHRYLGTVLPDGTATPAMRKWLWHGRETVQWIDSNTVDVVGTRNATTETTVNCASRVPPTSQFADLKLFHFHTGSIYFGNADDGVSLATTSYVWHMEGAPGSGVSNQVQKWMPLASNQTFTYRYGTAPLAGNGLYCWINGYQERR